MAQFAVKGYDVAANGFLVKPVSFSDLFLCMRRIMQILEVQKGKPLTVSSREGIHMLSSGDVIYIEVIRHMLTYHTGSGDYSGTGNLGELADTLSSDFFLCNRSYLVNFLYIKSVTGNEIEMKNGDRIPLSRGKRKVFLDAFNHWLGRILCHEHSCNKSLGGTSLDPYSVGYPAANPDDGGDGSLFLPVLHTPAPEKELLAVDCFGRCPLYRLRMPLEPGVVKERSFHRHGIH